MVGSIAASLTFTSETSLSLYPQNLFLDRYSHPVSNEKPVLVPEILEERELSPEGEALGYNRWGKMNRGVSKGLLIDGYM